MWMCQTKESTAAVQWLGPSAPFGNPLNKLQMEKLRHGGLEVPPHVRPMCLGSRAGSPSPPSTSWPVMPRCFSIACWCLLVPEGGPRFFPAADVSDPPWCRWVGCWSCSERASPPLLLTQHGLLPFHTQAQAGSTRTEPSCGHQTGRDQQLRITLPFRLCQSL